MGIEKAVAELKKGNMIVLFDDDRREAEADIIFHAKYVTPERIGVLRKDAGGLICVALTDAFAAKTGLPFYTDVLVASCFPIGRMACGKTAYGDRPAFSLSVNHKDVYTGITDQDRALTIRKITELAESTTPEAKGFVENFYSPGHVFLLIGRTLEHRKGHTELSLELAKKAGLSGVMVLCEMLGNGKALSKKEAEAYAKKNKIVFLEGQAVW